MTLDTMCSPSAPSAPSSPSSPSSPSARIAGLLVAAALTGVGLAGVPAPADAAPAGARHPIGADDLMHPHDVRLLGWSAKGADVSTYEDLGTSQSTIEPCQRTSLYQASGRSDVYTTNVYSRDDAFVGESVTQVDSPATARRLAARLDRQVDHCGSWRVRARHHEDISHGSVDWYRLADRASGNRYDVAAFVRTGRRVAMVGLTPQHRVGDARMERLLARVADRLR